jgi:hypothetical protein
MFLLMFRLLNNRQAPYFQRPLCCLHQLQENFQLHSLLPNKRIAGKTLFGKSICDNFPVGGKTPGVVANILWDCFFSAFLWQKHAHHLQSSIHWLTTGYVTSRVSIVFSDCFFFKILFSCLFQVIVFSFCCHENIFHESIGCYHWIPTLPFFKLRKFLDYVCQSFEDARGRKDTTPCHLLSTAEWLVWFAGYVPRKPHTCLPGRSAMHLARIVSLHPHVFFHERLLFGCNTIGLGLSCVQSIRLSIRVL